jgi:hypothetical protein
MLACLAAQGSLFANNAASRRGGVVFAQSGSGQGWFCWFSHVYRQSFVSMDSRVLCFLRAVQAPALRTLFAAALRPRSDLLWYLAGIAVTWSNMTGNAAYDGAAMALFDSGWGYASGQIRFVSAACLCLVSLGAILLSCRAPFGCRCIAACWRLDCVLDCALVA